MKIEITYEHNHDVDSPCCARTTIDGQNFLAIGRTWGNAADRLLDKVVAIRQAGEPPKPTKIEI